MISWLVIEWQACVLRRQIHQPRLGTATKGVKVPHTGVNVSKPGLRGSRA